MNQIHQHIQYAIKHNIPISLNDRTVNHNELIKLTLTSISLIFVFYTVLIWLIFETPPANFSKWVWASDIALSFTTSVWLISMYYWFTYVRPNVFLEGRVKDDEPKPVVVEQEVVEIVDSVEVVDLTATEYNPYIKKGAKYKDIVPYPNQTARLYDVKDLIFPLGVVPHILIAGETGSAKSTLAFNILRLIQYQERCDFVVCDYGDYDFPKNSIARSAQEITYIIKAVHTIMKGRQLEKQRNHRRIVLVIEELEGYLTEIEATLDKKEYKQIIGNFAQIGQLARKTKINVIGIVQSGRSEQLPTIIRNNLRFRFILKSDRLVSDMLGSKTYKLENLRPGYSWVSIINNFVEFPEVTEPDLSNITFKDLHMMAELYKKRFPELGDEECEE